MPYLEPLKKGTPQPKVRRLRPSTRPKVRKLATSGRDRYKGRGR